MGKIYVPELLIETMGRQGCTETHHSATLLPCKLFASFYQLSANSLAVIIRRNKERA